jgi:hypothetical protein
VFSILICCAGTVPAAVPLNCPAGLPIGEMQFSVQPPDAKLHALPLRGINRLEEGDKILYSPLKLRMNPKGGEVALVLTPAASTSNELPKLVVLEPHSATEAAEWEVPFRVAVVALVYGPSGVNAKHVKAFLTKDDDLIAQLADYAEKTAQTELLLAAIAAGGGPGGSDIDGAMAGFGSQYGLNAQIDKTQPRDQQTLAMIRTINPALGGVDPVNADSSQKMAQSAVLASSVAGMFFGTPFGLAAGGTALFINMRTIMFPNTEFRSSYAQITSPATERLDLCGKRDAMKPRTRVAYLWATRIPNAKAPAVKVGAADHLPVEQAAPLTVTMNDDAWKIIDRAHDWKLISESSKKDYPVKVKSIAAQKSLQVDLSGTKAEPGAYKLQAAWDWDTMKTEGQVWVAPLSDFKTAHLIPESQDKLHEEQGKIVAQAEGADFEFVDKVAVVKTGDKYNPPVNVPFSLPKGKQQGPQDRLEFELDTKQLAAGDYSLTILQQDGQAHAVPIKILPPGPTIDNTPLVVNAGEGEQSVWLHGLNLDRLAKLELTGATVRLGPIRDGGREALVNLKPETQPGMNLDLKEYAQNVSQPTVAANAVQVAGPRPQVLDAQISLPPGNSVSLLKGELPAGAFVSVALRVKNAGSETSVRMHCAGSGSREVVLRVGEQNPAGSVQSTGADALFLTFDPGMWPAGCAVSAALENRTEGRSKPYSVGKVVRVPRIDGFEMTDEKAGADYAGKLTGTDLEVIAKVGWSPDAGTDVTGLPVPLGGDSRKQSLQIALPWPPPSPKAPLWIWFRGETQGRATTVKY